jgi:sulfur carrier protein
MKIILHHPSRETEISGPKTVLALLRELKLSSDACLVIREEELITEDEPIKDSDVIEIRPVISGGTAAKKLR